LPWKAANACLGIHFLDDLHVPQSVLQQTEGVFHAASEENLPLDRLITPRIAVQRLHDALGPRSPALDHGQNLRCLGGKFPDWTLGFYRRNTTHRLLQRPE